MYCISKIIHILCNNKEFYAHLRLIERMIILPKLIHFIITKSDLITMQIYVYLVIFFSCCENTT